MNGSLEAIWIKRVHKGPMDTVDEARLVVDEGIEGNADRGGRRQVTIISLGAWERAQREVGEAVEPSVRRANLLVRGVDLEKTRGKVLAIGATRVGIMGETRPCLEMEEAQSGLRQALDPEWRGGAYGVVLAGGEIRIGDAAGWAEDEEASRFDPFDFANSASRAGD